MSKELGALNPNHMGVIGDNLSEEMFSKCKDMVDCLETFTHNILEKKQKICKIHCSRSFKNETIVYKRIKQLLPRKLENSV